MRATEGFTSVQLDIETQRELDLLLDALGEYAERRRSAPKDSNGASTLAVVADNFRLTIAEAAGL